MEDNFTTTCSIEIDSTYNAEQCYVLTYIYDYESVCGAT